MDSGGDYTKLLMYLIITMNFALKIVKMIYFMLYIFCHNNFLNRYAPYGMACHSSFITDYEKAMASILDTLSSSLQANNQVPCC